MAQYKLGHCEVAARQDCKALGFFRVPNNIQRPAKLLADKGDNVFVRAIHPDDFQATPTVMLTPFETVKQALQGVFTTMCRLRPGVCL